MSSPGSMAAHEAEPEDRARGRLASLVALGLGAAAVGGSVWIQAGERTGGELSTLALLVGAALLVAVGLRVTGRPAEPVGLALALFTAAVVGALAADLPAWPSALFAGDSPTAQPVYLAAGLGLIVFFAANPLALAPAELALLALVVFAAGNGKVWTRTNEDFFPLYAGLAAVALVAVPAHASSLRAHRPLLAVAAVFLAWVALAGGLGEDPGRTDELFARMLAGALAGWAAARVLTVAGVERALFAMAACGAAAFLAVPALLDASAVLDWDQILRGTRLRLFGLHPNLTGTFLAVQLVLAVGLWTVARGWRRGVLTVVVVGTLPTLYLSRSRTAWIAALLGLAVLVLARRAGRRVVLGLLGAAVLLFSVVVFVGPVREAVLRPTTSAQSLSQRIYLWDAAARLSLENPLLGIGPNNYFAHARTAATPSYYDNTDKSLHPHNLLLAVAEGTGLVGLGIFLVLLWGVAQVTLRVVGRSAAGGERAPPLAVVVLAGLATLVGANMFDLGLSQMTFVPTLFWLFAGLAIALERGSAAELESPAPLDPAPLLRVAGAAVFALLFAVRPFAGERLFRAGIHLQDLDDPTAALAEWEDARRLMPWATGPVVRAAQVSAAAGRTEEAHEFYRRAIELSPTHPRFRYRYALFLSSLGRHARAAEQCRRSLELDPRSPEEGTFRLLFAETLARDGKREEARKELKRAILVMPELPSRFEETGWTLPVEDGEALVFADLARELAEELAREAPELEGWDVRRRGNHVGRVLRQLGDPAAAVAMLDAIETSVGTLDVSLARLRTELRSDLGLDIDEDVAFRTEGKAGALLDVSVDPEVERARAELELGIVIDYYFEYGIFRELFQRLYEAAKALDDFEGVSRAFEGLLFFSDVNKRVEYLVEHVEELVRRGRADEALELVDEALVTCDALKHANGREQAAFKLATAALAAAKGRAARGRLTWLEGRLDAGDHGASERLFWIVCRLNLAPQEPSLEAEAYTRYGRLREDFPGEGEAIGKYFDQAARREGRRKP